MKSAFLKSIAMCAVAAAAIASPLVANAVTYNVQVAGAGSSAQFYVFAEAAYQQAKAFSGSTAKHYTAKNAGFVHDNRGASVGDEIGNLWVVWSQNSTGTAVDIWAYLSVDSTVGVRAFESAPRASLTFPGTIPPPGNIVTTWDDNSADVALDASVQAALSAKAFTAAFTDIRPEDALYASNHLLTGVGTCAGTAIKSTVTGSTAAAIPAKFSLTGNDPCSTSTATVPFVTIPVGAAPIVFIVNNSNTAAGHLGNSSVSNISSANATKLFDGSECDSTLFGASPSVAVTAWLREGLSGTMNTTEFSVFQPNGHSQEDGVTTNPLNQTCSAGGGSRKRGIGTGEIVTSVSGANPDNAGYIFFSYEAVNGKTNLKYVKLDNVDPFTTSGTYTGALPTCLTGSAIKCTVTPNTSFATLRNGTYKAWSVYRAISDNAHVATLKTLVTKAQAVAATGTGVPDFVPFSPVCGSSASNDEKGLDVYREHFSFSVSHIQSVANNTVTSTVTSTPNDGAVQPNVSCTTGGIRSLPFRTLGGYITANNTNTEVMGDVGGAIQGPFTGNPPVPGPTASVSR
jgi:hypothetical protein